MVRRTNPPPSHQSADWSVLTSFTLKGCCQSTARDDDQSSPYSQSNVEGDSSSRAIASAAPPVPETSTPRTSSHAHRTPRSARSRAPALAEHFNQPLRSHMWTARRRWNRRDLDREREEFFHTRVSGREEIWSALQTVVGLMADGEVVTAQGIIDASGVTLPTGDLINGAYDEVGNFYQMPEHIVSDPTNMSSQDDHSKGEAVATAEETDEDEAERKREEKGKNVLKIGESIKVRARLSDRGGPDVMIVLGKDQSVKTLSRRIQEETGIPGKGKVRIAYLGKVLKENESLLEQGWREGHVVNALVF